MKENEKLNVSKVEFEETDDLLHITILNGRQYQAVTVRKCEFEESAIEMIRCNYERLKRVKYGTICSTDTGTEISGWSFEFCDETVNFAHRR